MCSDTAKTGRILPILLATIFYLCFFLFKVTDKTDPFYIDGEDVKQSNWLRYVNCARTKQEQNCEAFQYKGHIYYKTLREITVGECNSWCLI